MTIPGIKIKTTDIAAALKESRGVVMYAAALLGCARSVIYERLQIDEKLRELVAAERKLLEADNALDDVNLAQKARESLHELLDKRDVTATIFTLKSKANFVQQSDFRGDIIVECIKQPYRRLTQEIEIADADTDPT